MQIIENPPMAGLDELQDILIRESPGGIVDIWVCINPLYVAAEHGGSIVGVASISMAGDAAEIYKIYVAPSQRRRGVAKKLFNEALLRLRRHGIKEVFLEMASEAGLALLQAVVLDHQIRKYDDKKYGIQLGG